MHFTRRSPLSGKEHTKDIPVTPERWADYKARRSGMIQDAFPDLTPGEREFLMTGITEDEWDLLFRE